MLLVLAIGGVEPRPTVYGVEPHPTVIFSAVLVGGNSGFVKLEISILIGYDIEKVNDEFAEGGIDNAVC